MFTAHGTFEDVNFSDDFDDSMSDVSLLSVSENEPQSINIDFSNGSPLNDGDFTIVHYNINSITAEGRLEQLNQVFQSLK